MTSTDKITVGNPIKARNHVLLPIERTSVTHDMNRQGCWCQCSKQLIALVVQTSAGIHAFELKTGPITISQLKKTVPEIEAYLKLADVREAIGGEEGETLARKNTRRI